MSTCKLRFPKARHKPGPHLSAKLVMFPERRASSLDALAYRNCLLQSCHLDYKECHQRRQHLLDIIMHSMLQAQGHGCRKKKQSSTQQPSLLSGSTEASSSSSIPSGSHCKIKAASAFSLISGMLPATNMYMSCNGHKAQGDVLHLWTRLDRLDSTTSRRWLAFTRSQNPMNRKLDFLLGLHVQAPAKQVQMLLVSVRNYFTL